MPKRDQRIVGVEGCHHDLADFAISNRIAGAGAHDLDNDVPVDHHAPHVAISVRRFVGDQPEVGGGVVCVPVMPRDFSISRNCGGKYSPDTDAFLSDVIGVPSSSAFFQQDAQE